MNVAILQTSTLPLGENKLEYYLDICAQKSVKLLLLPEYVLNNFFKELCAMPQDMINEQTQNHLKMLKEYAWKYKIAIVAPVVELLKTGIYKSTKMIYPEKKPLSYRQQYLICYEHWNEHKFFSNKMPTRAMPHIFMVNDHIFALMYGFETHFDTMFSSLYAYDVDCILVPSVGTFGSKNRWRELLKTRAFLNGCYLLRANRIGEYVADGTKWNFYGDSFCVLPNGDIEQALSEKEELLITKIDKELARETKKEWGFDSFRPKENA